MPRRVCSGSRKGSVLGTSIEDFEVLGVGVVVYFRVLSILACA